MPPMKTHSRKREKRKFTGNQYTKRKGSASADASVPGDENTELSGDEEHVEGEKIENFKSLSASERKLDTKSDDSSDESNGMEYADLQGFRIVDISVLSSVLASLRCPSCTKGNVCLEEDKSQKWASRRFSFLSVLLRNAPIIILFTLLLKSRTNRLLK